MSDFDFLPAGYNPKKAAEDAGGGDTVPNGKYEVMIKAAEMKTTQAGGLMVKLQLSITGPKYVRRVIFDQINVKHLTSAQAVEIGLAKFGSLCVAAGFQDSPPKSVTELIGRTLAVDVGIEKSEKYGDRNKVNNYLKGSGTQGAPVALPDDSFNDDDVPF